MLRRNIAVILACALLSFPVAARAGQEPQSGYYSDSHKGWWWGERKVEPEPE